MIEFLDCKISINEYELQVLRVPLIDLEIVFNLVGKMNVS
jgi:hypothetical protein